MRTKQQTLLAGVAALALFAANGIASAQQTQQDQKGGAAQSSSMQSQRGQQGAKNQSANQGMRSMRNQGALQSKNQNAMSKQPSGQNALNESKMQSGQRNAGKMSNAGKGEKSFNRSAQQQNKGAANRTAQGQQRQLNAQSKTQSKTGESRIGQFATQQGNKTQRGTSTTAQRNEQLKGLQGSTRAPMQGATSTEQRGGGAANVSLNDQQRTQIRDTVINSRSAPRVSNVDFNVNVGTVVPRGRIHMVAVPQTLFRIQPRWRHYMYFVFNNDIVIVDPRSMRIVDVLPV
jgi:hypothetical protein